MHHCLWGWTPLLYITIQRRSHPISEEKKFSNVSKKYEIYEAI